MELEKWIEEQLAQGVKVNRLFPCKYDGLQGGFGYEISLSRKEGRSAQQYKVLLTRKSIHDLTLVIHDISRERWDKDKDEEVCMALKGRRVNLNHVDPKTYASESSPFTITGTLTLEDKLS